MNKIKGIEKVKINDIELYFSIKSENTTQPILLYLHGGPGDACVPLLAKYNKALEKTFTVINLEQRGAGLSYYKFHENEQLSIETYVEDLHQFALYILKMFSKEKLYLVGHSWGSVLGLFFIQRYPELVEKYVGCGQVVNMKKTILKQVEFIREKSQKAAVLNKIDQIDSSLNSSDWLKELLFVTKQVVKLGGSLYRKNNQNKLVLPFLTSKDYSVRNLINRQKGAAQSLRYLWPKLMQVNFEETTSFKVPILLIEGRHDAHVSAQLAADYFETITSPKEFAWFEHSGHFPQWEEPDRFAIVITNLLNKTMLAAGTYCESISSNSE